MLIQLLILFIGRTLGESPRIEISTWKLGPERVVDFPSAPVCSIVHSQINATKAEPIALWRIKEDSLSVKGWIEWKEQVKTTCSRSFFGSDTTSVDMKKILPVDSTPIPLSDLRSITDQKELEEEGMFDCSWLSTTHHTSVRRWIKPVLITRNAKGHINIDGVRWQSTSPITWTDGTRRLYAPHLDHLVCPVELIKVVPAVVSKGPRGISLSIPESGLFFYIRTLDDHHFLCSADKSDIYQTENGYLVSFHPDPPSRVSRRRSRWTTVSDSPKLRSKREIHLDELDKLADNWEKAQRSFQMEELVSKYNEDMYTLHTLICNLKVNEWGNLAHPHLPDKIARYYTGSPHARGLFKGHKYIIREPHSPGPNCTLPSNKTLKHFLVQMLCEGAPTWVEPISNIIETNNSWVRGGRGFSLVLPNGYLLDYLDGSIRKKTFSGDIMHDDYVLETREINPIIYGELPQKGEDSDLFTPDGSLRRSSSSELGFLDRVYLMVGKTILLVGALILIVLCIILWLRR